MPQQGNIRHWTLELKLWVHRARTGSPDKSAFCRLVLTLDNIALDDSWRQQIGSNNRAYSALGNTGRWAQNSPVYRRLQQEGFWVADRYAEKPLTLISDFDSNVAAGCFLRIEGVCLDRVSIAGGTYDVRLEPSQGRRFGDGLRGHGHARVVRV